MCFNIAIKTNKDENFVDIFLIFEIFIFLINNIILIIYFRIYNSLKKSNKLINFEINKKKGKRRLKLNILIIIFTNTFSWFFLLFLGF